MASLTCDVTGAAARYFLYLRAGAWLSRESGRIVVEFLVELSLNGTRLL